MGALLYATPGVNSPGAGGIGWYNYGTLTLNPGNTLTGLTGTFTDGSTVTFNLASNAISGGGRPFVARTTPVFVGAPFGTNGYTSIGGNVALYEPSGTYLGRTTQLVFSNIVLKDPLGNSITSYSVIVADAEITSTNGGGGFEKIQYDAVGGVWQQLVMLPPSGNPPQITGLGTTQVIETGIGMVSVASPVFIVNNATQVSATLYSPTVGNPGNQAIAVGFAINKVTLSKYITLRRDASDQFVLGITGPENSSFTTTGSSTGTQPQIAYVYGATGGTYTVDETMAVGSVSSLSDYHRIVGATNLSAGGTVPATGTAPQSVTLGLGDIINYTITNTPLEADLSITKTASSNPIVAGTTLTYTLAISNAGPDPATNVVLTDAIPAVVQNPEYSTDGGVTWSLWIGTLALGNVAVGNTTILIRGVVNTLAIGIINNTASVSSTTLDPNPNNNTSSIITGLDTLADISIVKTDSPNPVIAGNTLTYTLVVSNAGPSVARSVTLTDAVPVSIQSPEYSTDGGLNWTTWTGTLPLGDLAIGNTTIEIRGKVSQLTTGTINNTATVSSTTSDPDPSNNTSSTATQVNTSADVAVVKTDSPNPVIAGNTLTYTIVVSNAGPSQAQAVFLTDAVPVSIQNPEYSTDGGLTWINWTGSLLLGSLIIGSTTVIIRGKVNLSATGTINNTAQVSSSTPDPDPNNNTSTTSTQVNTSADVAVVKTDNPNPVIAGNTLTYTIVVSNAGPSVAQTVSLADTMPVSIQNPEYSTDGGLTWAAWTGILPIGNLGIGNMTIEIRGKVNPTTTATISNTATVSSSTPDPDPNNNTSSTATQVNTSADVSVVKTENPDPVIAGTTITYTLVVANAGPSEAKTVTITDAISTSIQNPEYSTDGGATWSTWTGTLGLGDLAVSTLTILIRGKVDPAAL